MDQQEHRLIVESLRSGVPSRLIASLLPMGRETLLARAEQDLRSLNKTGPKAGFIQANYGDGKTHLLHAVWDLAWRLNCVVSFVVLSKETPFDKLHKLYAKLVANTYLPGSSQPGVEALLGDVHQASTLAGEILSYAEANLHLKVSIALRNYLEGHSVDTLHDLAQDLSGDFISAQTLKAIHRLNFGESIQLGRFAQTRDSWDYFRLLDMLVSARGFTGWVILFDEAELIGKLGLASRARAYANVTRFLAGDYGLSRTYTLFAFANSYFAEVLRGRNDMIVAPEWFRVRDDEDSARMASQGLDAIADADNLQPLSKTELGKIMAQIVDAHAHAYAWTPPLDGESLWGKVAMRFPSPDTKLRTRVRAAVHWLDHLMQYGEDPAISFSGLVEETLVPDWPDKADAAPAESLVGSPSEGP